MCCATQSSHCRRTSAGNLRVCPGACNGPATAQNRHNDPGLVTGGASVCSEQPMTALRRVLFVDDQQEVLEGLRDALRPRRREWSMAFANGGAAALAELDAAQ